MRQYQRRTQDAGSVIFRSTDASLVCVLHIKITIAFCVSVSNNGCGMVANHGSGIIACKFPHREDAAFALLQDERTDKSLIQIRIDNRH